MEKTMFEELMQSVKQAKEILGNPSQASRIFKFDSLDVKFIRDQFSLSQNKFAQLLGISVATLRNWEQGRRQPEGAAKTLLLVAARHPEAVLDVNKRSLKVQL